MRIEIIRIEPIVKIKIQREHGLTSEEVERTFEEGEPIFNRVGGGQHRGIGKIDRYITVFFVYNEKRKQATIKTAYLSDEKQIRYYKKTRGS